MAYYNSYYSTGYSNPYYAIQPNYTIPTQTQQQPTQQMVNINNNGIVLIASEGDAQAYPVAPGNSQWMKDQYKDYLYIKTVDSSGMIMPLRKFKLIEETTENTTTTTQQAFNPDLYVTWEALEKRLAEQKATTPKNKIPVVKKVTENVQQQQ